MKKLIIPLAVMLLAILSCNLTKNLISSAIYYDFKRMKIDDDRLVKMDFSMEFRQLARDFAAKYSVSEYETVAVNLIANDYIVPDQLLPYEDFTHIRNRLTAIDPDKYFMIVRLYQGILEDVKYFPVAVNINNEGDLFYDNSWGNERTYGGTRIHEGVDICSLDNKAGVYPIVSVCDGVVTNQGWLELGGYRIGITSANGLYYYYAHLDSYAHIKTGDTVKAGQVIGYMGNTGYSKVEGTKGKFNVHLHFGIYFYDNNCEIPINPYNFLRLTDKNVLYFK